jgi:tripartite-type tricarboxylate transporter receptor subunit TctC
VVGFGVGGPTDIPARFIADKLSEALGQRVFVENKPASGGIVATRDVIARPADGHTLLLCTHFEPINVAAYKDPGFGLSDLAAISLIAKYYYGLAVSNAIPPTDVGSFIAYAKAHPGQVNYGLRLSPGNSGAAAGEGRRHHDESGAISRRCATRAGDRRRAH